MGWLWSSVPSVTAPETQKSSANASDAQSLQQQSTAPPTPSTSAPNEPADPEVQKFFDLFQTDKSANPSSQQEQQQQHSSSTEPSSSWLSSLRLKSKPTTVSHEQAPPGNDLSEALLPSDMSCRQAFDRAWACNSMGGQWNAVYRYGTMRSCSEQWDDFWFCMRTKSYSGEMRENMIRAHYRNKEYAKYGPDKPSSEDVWESREEKVPEGSVFNEKIE